MNVTLTPAELHMAATVAAERHIESLLSGREDRHGARHADNGLGLHFDGACGELAYCKARDVHWGGTVNSFKGPDVGERVQVRTRSRDDYDLIVRQDDSDLDWFVLVTGRPPGFAVRGYIRGRDAKRREWLADHGGHGPAFFVPQSALAEFPSRAAA